MTPVLLFTAEELKAIPSLSAQERDAIERACERNREWIATGASAVLVRTADVRELLGATAKLIYEVLRRDQETRAQQVTLPDTPIRCPRCGAIRHTEVGALRCRLCGLSDSGEGGP